MIKFGEARSIPEKEIRFTASRSGGPGGQNVNKVSTRVTLFFDIIGTSALSEEEKLKIRERLPTRVSKEGILRVVCRRHRSQAKNRKAAVNRLVELLETALDEKAPRVKAKVSDSMKRRRLEEKARRSRMKQLRSKPVSIDD
jgi:ribosome-associated protein